MESHYEINVSLNGKHYFATASRSFNGSEEKALRAVIDFRGRFPKSEGFNVSCTYWKGTGYVMDF